MADKQNPPPTVAPYRRSRIAFTAAVVMLNVLITSLILIAVRWPPPGAVSIETATASSPAVITVIVGGEVARPGVYTLVAPATVGDAVQAAGGSVDEAAMLGVDQEAPLSDGQQVWLGGSGGSRSSGVKPLVDINSASVQELESLSGVGPTLAARIVAYREEHGSFSTIEELLNVSGIGQATLDGLRAEAVAR